MKININDDGNFIYAPEYIQIMNKQETIKFNEIPKDYFQSTDKSDKYQE
jgi:hypothetical protein